MTQERSPLGNGSPVVLWFRQDLRLHDQAALHAAIETGCPVVPVYVLDEHTPGAWRPGGASRWWLHMSLAALADALAARGSRLVLRRGIAAQEIAVLARELGAGAVLAGQAYEPWARRQEAALAEALAEQAIGLRLFRTTALFNHDALRTKTGGSFGVYSPFARACLASDGPPVPQPAPAHIPAGPAIRSDDLAAWRLLPTRPDWAGGLRETWKPGEVGARARLRQFLGQGLTRYDMQRDLPGIDGTSMLSPHLHWGEISAGQVWHAAIQAAEGRGGKALETYLKEVLWREFSIHLLWHQPDLPDQPLRTEFARMPWREDAAALLAWQKGRTGIPIVDAGMRQLWHLGWLHNRVRMVVASFLIKHLLIPWQVGEAWFWDTLVDADLASNSASWQWVAGCGADAAPYFRIFNPVLQGLKFDTDGAYVRRWVPELARLETRFLHAPWDAPEEALARAGVRLGDTYPKPLIDLADGRNRALEAYRSLSRPGT
jgi:deoxyribodipyrimidine photo-lyase